MWLKEDSIAKYGKHFEEINNLKDQIEYQEIRKYIKNKYKSEKKYDSLEKIQLEKERVIDKLNQMNSQFPAIAMALLIMFFSLLVPAFSEVLSNLLPGNIKYFIQILYSIFILVYTMKVVTKPSDEFRCLRICKNVLEELEKEKLEEISNESNEIVDDIKDIKKFLGI